MKVKPTILILFLQSSIAFFSCGSEENSRDSDSQNPTPSLSPSKGKETTGSSPVPKKTIVPTPSPSVAPTKSPADEGLSFAFQHNGVIGTIGAKIKNFRDIELDSIPSQFEFELKRISAASNFVVDSAFCTALSTKLSEYRSESDFGKSVLETSVRGDSSQLFYVTARVIPTNDGRFENSAFRAAAAKFPKVSFAKITQDIKFVRSNLKIVAEPGALVNVIGDIPVLEGQLFVQELDYIGGQFYGRIMAQDLLCDLWSGKAKIQYELETAGGAEATSVSKGVK